MQGSSPHDPGESGLATLSWTQEAGDRMDSETLEIGSMHAVLEACKPFYH